MQTESCKLTPDNRLALLMHDTVASPYGKMGFGLMRYGVAPVVVVIDRAQAGKNLAELTGIECNAPIVSSVRKALAFDPDVLVPAVAPAGGALPADWWAEVKDGVAAGLSLVNGLHRPLANDPELAPLAKPGRFIWDIRVEPPGLENGMGRARNLPAKRVLMVGTDMADGKMTAAIELDREAKRRGLRSKFLATGQIGIAIAGEGIAIDAVRIDFATGAAERLVMDAGYEHDFLFIEGQGSLLHPASTATYTLVRGTLPTHMILVHRAGKESIARAQWVKIPPLKEVIALYEYTAGAGGALPASKVAGVALNCSHLDERESRRVIEITAKETGLPVTDVLRFGVCKLLNAVIGRD